MSSCVQRARGSARGASTPPCLPCATRARHVRRSIRAFGSCRRSPHPSTVGPPFGCLRDQGQGRSSWGWTEGPCLALQHHQGAAPHMVPQPLLILFRCAGPHLAAHPDLAGNCLLHKSRLHRRARAQQRQRRSSGSVQAPKPHQHRAAAGTAAAAASQPAVPAARPRRPQAKPPFSALPSRDRQQAVAGRRQ